MRQFDARRPARPRPRRRAAHRARARVHAVRRLLDDDGSGGLDMAELQGFTALLGLAISEAECTGMLRENIQSDALKGDSPELDFDGFCQLVEPVLIELQEQERRVNELAAPPVDAEGHRLPPGDFEESSLGCLKLTNPVRRAVIRLVSRREFDLFVLLLIGMNAVLMAMEDPLRDQDNPTELEQKIHVLELVFVRAHPPAYPLPLVRGAFTHDRCSLLRTFCSQWR